jgi:hypothetical protein
MAHFLNDPSDVQWLKDTHLKGREYPNFASFILHGNEDDPNKLELFEAAEALVSDVPFTVNLRVNLSTGEVQND